MRARTLIDLLTLSSNLYLISKDKELIHKLHDLTDKGKDRINEFMSTKDKDGNDIEFLEKLALKAHEVKEELEARIAEVVEEFYKKVNIAHVNEIKALNARIEELSKQLNLLDARLNQAESK